LSSQRTTTHQNNRPPSRWPASGALVQLYPRYFAPSNSGFDPISTPQNNCKGTTEHYTAVSRAHFAGFRQDGRRRPSKGPACSPVSLAARQQYNFPPPPPSRPPHKEDTSVEPATPCGQPPRMSDPSALLGPTQRAGMGQGRWPREHPPAEAGTGQGGWPRERPPAKAGTGQNQQPRKSPPAKAGTGQNQQPRKHPPAGARMGHARWARERRMP
jgi:hypothetical protein